ncbi:PQQ-binding-like beta-propeller repeat protein [Streptomyces sp. NPDC051976]|uniref:outer membrane protein assembly factor BamB family protein n=1 Tax=Streptomyces sp. NPDC051976 TaxID=3154947 RepID=UPI003414B1BB
MSQPPPPPPGNPPPPPGGGYGYPAQAPGPGPAPSGENPYAQPVPPGQNPYAQAPTQAAFPQQQYPQQGPPQGPPPPPPAPGYGGQQPYGQGQMPQGQPQYGYPQQAPGQPYGTPPPYQVAPGGPGGQPRNNNKTLGIIAGVVAAVLVIGGGVYLATKGGGGDDPKPKPLASGQNSGKPTHSSTLSYKWDKPADPVAEKDNLKNTVGIWFTDKYVVKNEINKVVGYDQSTGAVAWTIPAPSSGDCSAARDSYNNLAAIQFGADCEQIMVIDMAKGKPAWTANLPSSSGKPDFNYTEMAISGDTVGIDWMRGSIAYRLSTQKVLWQSGDGNCEDDGYAGGKQFVAVVNCDYKSYEVQVLDTENNGKAKWSWQAPAGTKVSAIVSTDPVVVLLGSDDATFTDVVTLNAGRLQSRVSLGTDKYDISDDGTEKQAVHNVLVSSDTLYLTLRSSGGASNTAGIAAFNLSDGKPKWVAKPTDKHDISGLDFADGKLLAYEPADYELSGALVTIDPATGKIAPYATFDDASKDRLDGSSLRNYPVWHNGHFYLATRTVYATDNSQSYLVSFG